MLFAEEAGNTTAQDLVDLVGTRLEAYRRAGLPAWAVVRPAASFVADALAVLALDAVVVPLPRQMSEWERERTEELAATTHLAAPLDWPLLPGAGCVVAGERLIARKPPGEAPPNGAASAQLTSGTSGRTKVALRPLSALMAEEENYRTALDRPGSGRSIGLLALRWPIVAMMVWIACCACSKLSTGRVPELMRAHGLPTVAIRQTKFRACLA